MKDIIYPKNYFNWPYILEQRLDNNRQSYRSFEYIKIFARIRKVCPYRLDCIEKIENDLYFRPPGSSSIMSSSMKWMEDNIEHQWTFIYSREKLHVFFEDEDDKFKFMLYW